ncbi:hypothetical protein LCGC14_1186150 [marine sediment metagenome]|uniref:Methyltransferase domain-containing protein n=1 Tax=marine sediment metagenome TaxID=412755 RepID=A0A0F9LKP2_9ZZZZ
MIISKIPTKIIDYLKKKWLKVYDPKRLKEIGGQRVVFNYLRENGFLNNLKYKKILEIGPKHGKDSVLLAKLQPSELVLIDLPSKRNMVEEWLPIVSKMCKTKFIQSNILYLNSDYYKQIGKFDLIWCLGVIYHNIEQVRLLKRLFDLCNVNGKIVIESSLTRNKKLTEMNVIEILYPKPFRGIKTITHHPSRLAIKSWLEMVGFINVTIKDIYSKKIRWQRAVLTGLKTVKSKPYEYYNNPNGDPGYVIGNAT